MTLYREVLDFARDYINSPKSRTPQRKAQIKTVYKEVFGELFNVRCGTCYIAALIKLVNQEKQKKTIQKITIMASINYKLKPGAILQAFGHREKNVFKSEQLTDELAEWHIKNNPSCIGKFAKLPVNFTFQEVNTTDPILKIVPVLDVDPEKLDVDPEKLEGEVKENATPADKPADKVKPKRKAKK
jgi:hypothetical protein